MVTVKQMAWGGHRASAEHTVTLALATPPGWGQAEPPAATCLTGSADTAMDRCSLGQPSLPPGASTRCTLQGAWPGGQVTPVSGGSVAGTQLSQGKNSRMGETHIVGYVDSDAT